MKRTVVILGVFSTAMLLLYHYGKDITPPPSNNHPEKQVQLNPSVSETPDLVPDRINVLPFTFIAGSALDANAVIKIATGELVLIRKDQPFLDEAYYLESVSDDRIVVRERSTTDLLIVYKAESIDPQNATRISSRSSETEQLLPVIR